MLRLHRCRLAYGASVILVTCILPRALFSADQSAALKEGAGFEFADAKATVTKLDTLPFVDDEYTRRFKFDSCDNPKLKELREKYKLDAVVAPGKDEFEKQVLLNDWTHNQFKKFGKPSANPKGALETLKAVEEGNTFFCAHYARTLVSAAASLGWVDRELALRRHQGGNRNGGSTEHSTTEIWSNQYHKWVMLDPTSNLYVEKDGIPLNGFEIREQWFYHDGKDLLFVIGKERKKYKKSDLPVFLKRFEGFGNLTYDPDEPDKYGFIGYIPNTNLMDAELDYGKMFIVKDKLCEGTKWHERKNPANPAVEPYFPLGQSALSLVAEGDKINVAIKTMTPNFGEYRMQVDGAGWNMDRKSDRENFTWKVHPGTNKLEVKTVNLFGIDGPVSTAIIELSK